MIPCYWRPNPAPVLGQSRPVKEPAMILRYADDGFGNLIRLTWAQLDTVLNVCYPECEDDI